MLIGMSANASNMSTELLFGTTKHDHDTKAVSATLPYTLLYEKEERKDETFGIRQTFRMSDRMTFEIGYQDLGEASVKSVATANSIDYGTKASIDMDALTIGFKAGYDFYYGLSLHGRVGLAKWNASIEKEQTITGKSKANDSDIDPYFGFEAKYHITPRFSLGLNHTIYNMDSDFIISNIYMKSDSNIKDTAIVIGFHY